MAIVRHHWNSHYKTLKSLVNMLPTIVQMLEFVEKGSRYWKIVSYGSPWAHYLGGY
jgi:glutathionyl-hydroquinone reductase